MIWAEWPLNLLNGYTWGLSKTTEERAEARAKADERNKKARESNKSKTRTSEGNGRLRQSTLSFSGASSSTARAPPQSKARLPFDASHVIKVTQKGIAVRTKHVPEKLLASAEKTAQECIGVVYANGKGEPRTYSVKDMKYDLNIGYIA